MQISRSYDFDILKWHCKDLSSYQMIKRFYYKANVLTNWDLHP